MSSGRGQPAIGPRLRVLLAALLAAAVLLTVNSLYLAGVTWLEWLHDQTYQDFTYQVMFLFHLILGLAILLPMLVFIVIHMRNTWHRRNRRAVRAGLALGASVLALLITGLLLIRFEWFQINDPRLRSGLYWLHVLVPFVIVWLFILHRLAGPPIRWRVGLTTGGLGAAFALVLVVLQAQDPRDWGRPGIQGEADFSPSLLRTASGQHIPAERLMIDGYCASCHLDAHDQWQQSAHRFASFDNPVYLFSVRNTRAMAMARDGNTEATRFCAACHDLVPLLSGALDDPNFDDVHHPTANAGINCVGCHAITHVNSPRGTGDFTIEEPIHYPFAFSESATLQWVSRQLIKAKPDFHNRTFLKPVHQQPEFCSSCHKLHLPEELNHYRWLRGQNHHDSHLLSGVSGHGVASFYYPNQAQPGCNGCHMPQVASNDFGARQRNGFGVPTVSNHLFPGANTGLAHLMGLPEETIDAHRDMLQDSLRVDLVALREGGTIDGPILGPIRPEIPALQPGQTYLLQVVVRNLTVGHHFTQGTADSNEAWVEVHARHHARDHEGEPLGSLGHSGGLAPVSGEVDPWSHFVNVYMLDRHGQRIAQRNPEDIFVPLYDHQIPPGSADLLHYRLEVPADAEGELSVVIRLNYRKFDTTLMRYVQGESFAGNDLPITVIAEDRVTFPIGGPEQSRWVEAPAIPEWERWNDYGIGALLKRQNRQLSQAEALFKKVEALGRGEGALNLARVYLQEGRLDEAAVALRRAARAQPEVYPWSLTWFSGLLLFQQGQYEAAIEAFMGLVETRFHEARSRGFDFARDYRLLNQLALAWVELAAQRPLEADLALAQAEHWLQATLALDPENVTAHYNLARVYRLTQQPERAHYHAERHQQYRVDDNARDRAVATARRNNPAADHAADPVVIYDLHREGRGSHPQPVSTAPSRLARR